MSNIVAPYAVLTAVRTKFSQDFDRIMASIEWNEKELMWTFAHRGENHTLSPDGTWF